MSASNKRMTPISVKEKSYLLHLINENKILLDKRTTKNISIVKMRVWEDITQAFNAASIGGPACPVRSVKQLQKIWDHMKQTAKKEYAHAIRNQVDVSETPLDVSEDSKTIIDILKEEIGDSGNEFDSDNTMYSGMQQESSGSPLSNIYANSGYLTGEGTAGQPSKQEQSPEGMAGSSSDMGNYMGDAVETVLTIPTEVSEGSNTGNVESSQRKRKYLEKFEAWQENWTPPGKQRAFSINPQTGEPKNNRLFDLLHAEAQKRIDHFENLCQEDKERLSSIQKQKEHYENLCREDKERIKQKRKKEKLKRKLLKQKIKQTKKQVNADNSDSDLSIDSSDSSDLSD